MLQHVMKDRPKEDWDNADLVATLLASAMTANPDPYWKDDLLELAVLQEAKEELDAYVAAQIEAYQNMPDKGKRILAMRQETKPHYDWLEMQMRGIPGGGNLTANEVDGEFLDYNASIEDKLLTEAEVAREEERERHEKELNALMGARSVFETGMVDDETGDTKQTATIVAPLYTYNKAKQELRALLEEFKKYPKATEAEAAAAKQRYKAAQGIVKAPKPPDPERLAAIADMDSRSEYDPVRRIVAGQTEKWDQPSKKFMTFMDDLAGWKVASTIKRGK